jgi:hypothetical protein
VRLAIRLSICVAVGVGLFLAAILLPHPQGIWYFGRRPQWLVALDHAGLTIGPSSDAVLLGRVPVLLVKLAVVALPVWLSGRYAFRWRRRHAVRGGESRGT